MAPAEDRSYLLFCPAALTLALGAGLLLGMLAGLAPLLGWRLPDAALVGAHAVSELDGWLGLFVSGFGLRLVHRAPLPGVVSMSVLGLLFAGVTLRLAGLVGGPRPWALLAGEALQGTGTLLFAFAAGYSIWRGRGAVGVSPGGC